jgi:hypothetical protein
MQYVREAAAITPQTPAVMSRKIRAQSHISIRRLSPFLKQEKETTEPDNQRVILTVCCYS